MKIRSPIVRKRTRLEIIPLIDIMFFLLASFMMVSLQMQKVRTLKASLPTATQATSIKKPDVIHLYVEKDGQVEADSKAMTFAELRGLLDRRLHVNTNVPVYLSGSRETTHGDMMYLLDFVKRAGIRQVALSLRPERTTPGESP